MGIRADLSRLTLTQAEELTGRDRRWLKERIARAALQPVETTKRERWYGARALLEAVYATGDEIDLTSERARLAKEQADAQALKNAEARGELVRGDLVEGWLVRLLGAVTQRIRAIPPKAAPEVRATGSDAEAEALLGAFHDEALQQVADAVRDASRAVARLRSRSTDPRGSGDGGSDSAAAAGDGEPVGGPRAAAEPGEQRGAGAVADGEG